jgi:hypothetical protein
MLRMYRVTIECLDVPDQIGPQGSIDIEREFREHRPWQTDAKCTFSSGKMTLSATNDFDEDGHALLDEFWDCLAAYVGVHGEMKIVSVEELSGRGR